jgi:hypothetical protein
VDRVQLVALDNRRRWQRAGYHQERGLVLVGATLASLAISVRPWRILGHSQRAVAVARWGRGPCAVHVRVPGWAQAGHLRARADLDHAAVVSAVDRAVRLQLFGGISAL